MSLKQVVVPIQKNSLEVEHNWMDVHVDQVHVVHYRLVVVQVDGVVAHTQVFHVFQVPNLEIVMKIISSFYKRILRLENRHCAMLQVIILFHPLRFHNSRPCASYATQSCV